MIEVDGTCLTPKFLRPLIFMSLFFLAVPTAQSATGHDANAQKQINLVLLKTSKRIEKVAPLNPFADSRLNNSLDSTRAALALILAGENGRRVLTILEEASSDYPGNTFVLVLQAVCFDRAGELGKANASFKEFLLNSQELSPFEETFLKWAQWRTLRTSIFDLLRQRGLQFPKNQPNLKPGLAASEFIHYAANPNRHDRAVTLFFPLVLLGGGVALVIALVMGYEFLGPFSWNLPNLYFIAWIAYIVWIADLAFGLPFDWSRFFIIPVLMALALIFFLITGFLGLWMETKSPLEEGYWRCPHCSSVILKLLIECPDCRRKVHS